MPRVTITSSCPRASTAMTDVWEKTFPRFRVVRKTGVVSPTIRIRMTRISAGPARSDQSPAWRSP